MIVNGYKLSFDTQIRFEMMLSSPLNGNQCVPSVNRDLMMGGVSTDKSRLLEASKRLFVTLTSADSVVAKS